MENFPPVPPAAPSVRYPLPPGKVVLVRIHGKNPAVMLPLASRVGGMQFRRIDIDAVRAKAEADEKAADAVGVPVAQRERGLKVDSGRQPVEGASNGNVGAFVRGLLATGYEVGEIFFLTEERQEAVKLVLQATLRHPSAGPVATPAPSRALEQRPASETVEAMTPRLLRALDVLVGTRLDVFDNIDRVGADGSVVPGTVTVNLSGPVNQPVKNRLGYEGGELTLTHVPQAPRPPHAAG